MDFYITDYHVSSPDAVALEDSVMEKDRPVTAGSKILKNFVSPISATVVERLRQRSVEIAGRTHMREFGIGRLSHDRPEEMSGAVRAVAGGAVRWALCNDVFGINRRQAALHGVCYLHPTYGTVSRFGLIPLASSMDQIGVACRDMTDGFGLLSYIAGKDPKDGAMFPEKEYHYQNSDKKITMGIPSEVASRAGAGVQARMGAFAERFDTVDIELPHFDAIPLVMTILSFAEISGNISRYDGVKFGYRTAHYKGVDDLYTLTRTEGLGLEAKLAAIMGSMALSREYYTRYYEKALRARRLIKESLRFDTYDVLALPASIGDDPCKDLSLYALAPLAGLPSVTFSYQGQGIQLIAGVKKENTLLTAWEALRG